MAGSSLAQRRSNATAKADALTVDYFMSGDTMIIASASHVGRLYTVTATECSCPAGRQELPCKHAAYRLQVMAQQTKRQYTQADYDELF